MSTTSMETRETTGRRTFVLSARIVISKPRPGATRSAVVEKLARLVALRALCRKAWGFESLRPHRKKFFEKELGDTGSTPVHVDGRVPHSTVLV